MTITSAASLVRSHNPADPAELVAEAPAVPPADVHRAAERARAAGRGWVAAGASARCAALGAAADRLAASADTFADLIVREVGKPITEARGEVARAVAILRYNAQQVYDPVGSVHEPAAGPGLLLTRRRPYGLAGLITPWNFPLAIPLWKAAPALATGNAVLLKPAPQALGCAQQLAELLDAVLPADLFTVLPGEAGTGAAVVEAADVVSFTGSTAVGLDVVRAGTARGVPVQAEMGGCNAALVLPDADVRSTAAQLIAAAFGYAGQKCTATRRIIVVGDPDPLREALDAATRALPVGDPADAATVCGPVVTEAARDRVRAALDSATAAGGRVLTSGSAHDGAGWFATPTILEQVPAGHAALREEVFGPVAVLQRAGDLEQAIALARDVPHGLVTSVHTRDLDAALAVVDRIDTGLVKVNAPTTGVDFHLPFGGTKASSHGPREQGRAAADFYTATCTVSLLPANPTGGG
ncbi:aldehyde dehydrogenase family protein [Embleya sp. NPDC050493]|uniref:aldehyde dehydrogenase family protein n=1 Tax=Embleya sp. NPDC050493 TaxID=3363989 RepID=UPI0037B0599A